MNKNSLYLVIGAFVILVLVVWGWIILHPSKGKPIFSFNISRPTLKPSPTQSGQAPSGTITPNTTLSGSLVRKGPSSGEAIGSWQISSGNRIVKIFITPQSKCNYGKGLQLPCSEESFQNGENVSVSGVMSGDNLIISAMSFSG